MGTCETLEISLCFIAQLSSFKLLGNLISLQLHPQLSVPGRSPSVLLSAPQASAVFYLTLGKELLRSELFLFSSPALPHGFIIYPIHQVRPYGRKLIGRYKFTPCPESPGSQSIVPPQIQLLKFH